MAVEDQEAMRLIRGRLDDDIAALAERVSLTRGLLADLEDGVDDLTDWVLAFDLHVETILAIRRCHRLAAGLPPNGPLTVTPTAGIGHQAFVHRRIALLQFEKP